VKDWGVADCLRHVATRVAGAGRSGGLWWAIALSLGLAVLSIAIAAAVVVSWSADRFKEGAPASFLADDPPPLRALARLGKNLAGLVLLLLGAVMALPGVPGQGILTMIIGLTLLDFPGKLALERRLVSRPFVLRQLNGLRGHFRRGPLDLG
jgi:hypothetical protein